MIQTALIVEDEKLIREGLKTIIKRSEVPVEEILECSNGIDALKILQNQKIDIMFTDIRMPKMDGLELVRKTKDVINKPLIVAISGYDDFNYAVQLMREGVREYLLKPVERGQIKEVLHRLNQEIEIEKAQEEEQKHIRDKLLKYYIIDDKVSEHEKELIISRYSNLLQTKEYRVICAPKTSNEQKEFKKGIMLEDDEGQALYVIDCKEDENCLKEKIHYIGISRKYENFQDLNQAYKEACFARQEAFVEAKKYSYFEVDKGEASEGTVQNSTFDEGQMLQMAQMIGTYKAGQAQQLLKIMKDAVLKKELTFRQFKENIQILIKEIMSLYHNILNQKKLNQHNLGDLLQYSTINDYMYELIAWTIKINESILNRVDDNKNRQKIDEAIKYIKAYYHTDLNMTVVSNHISMNYSLFSHVFKQHTGKNFVAYLKDLRMEEAKYLLIHTHLKINEISHQIGYENEKHFMKTFKNIFGVSPTEYRKNMSIKDSV